MQVVWFESGLVLDREMEMWGEREREREPLNSLRSVFLPPNPITDRFKPFLIRVQKRKPNLALVNILSRTGSSEME